MPNSTAVVRRSVALPRALAATSEKARGCVTRWLAQEKIIEYALAEIKRQLFAVVPLHAKDKETGEWVRIGEKPDTRARQWAVDRCLDLAGAYPTKDRGNKEEEMRREKVRELIAKHSSEPVAVLEFYYKFNRWPTLVERDQLVNVSREITPAKPLLDKE